MNKPLSHLGIIMDGNGRWAQMRKRPRTFGHIKGARVAKKMISECARMQVPYLTLYAFSSENWFRPHAEVSFLMALLKRYLQRETQNLVKQNIKFNVIGDLEKVPKDALEAILFAKQSTENNTGMVLTFAISYGSRQEIVKALQALAQKVEKGLISSHELDEVAISQHLMTRSMPDPDLIIRTSGEQRLSNFLMWQAAYSEFYFTKTLWPDFTCAELGVALASFEKRERRFGNIETLESLNH
jgi:undecaprenyl diphosphate synthase